MRFLHSKTLEFCEFPSHKDVAYAILSHTWGPDEVLFEELNGLNAETTPPAIKQRSGYKKIQACCAQAASDGFEYAWVDTCCIDKRSSAELSEAINSMYRWYQYCAVCYAYLADVPNDVDAEMQRWNLRASRWFKRGWTLQELIAPRVLEFYGDQWFSHGQEASLGTQQSLSNMISEITRIPSAVLRGCSHLSYSSAQKMSWAAGRETTREEDRAYSLMGLFNVNMPLLYGEGKRAFFRLQEELMKISADETLFAWRMPEDPKGLRSLRGLLAMSPDDFVHSASIVQDKSLIGSTQRTAPSSVTNMGLRLEIMLLKASNTRGAFCSGGAPYEWVYENDSTYVVVLNCHNVDSTSLVGITGYFPEGYEERTRNSQFVRSPYSPYGGLVFLDPNNYQPSVRDRTTIFAALGGLDPFHLEASNGVAYNGLFQRPQWLRMHPQGFRLVDAWPSYALIKRKEGEEISFVTDNLLLLFDNGEDAFVIHSSYEDGGLFRVQIYLSPSGKSLYEQYGLLNLNMQTALLKVNGSDRVFHRLSSGRTVYASCRPQQVDYSVGYGLYIFVDEKEPLVGQNFTGIVET